MVYLPLLQVGAHPIEHPPHRVIVRKQKTRKCNSNKAKGNISSTLLHHTYSLAPTMKLVRYVSVAAIYPPSMHTDQAPWAVGRRHSQIFDEALE
jgi:hypothetical protein